MLRDKLRRGANARCAAKTSTHAPKRVPETCLLCVPTPCSSLPRASAGSHSHGRAARPWVTHGGMRRSALPRTSSTRIPRHRRNVSAAKLTTPQALVDDYHGHPREQSAVYFFVSVSRRRRAEFRGSSYAPRCARAHRARHRPSSPDAVGALKLVFARVLRGSRGFVSSFWQRIDADCLEVGRGSVRCIRKPHRSGGVAAVRRPRGAATPRALRATPRRAPSRARRPSGPRGRAVCSRCGRASSGRTSHSGSASHPRLPSRASSASRRGASSGASSASSASSSRSIGGAAACARRRPSTRQRASARARALSRRRARAPAARRRGRRPSRRLLGRRARLARAVRGARAARARAARCARAQRGVAPLSPRRRRAGDRRDPAGVPPPIPRERLDAALWREPFPQRARNVLERGGRRRRRRRCVVFVFGKVVEFDEPRGLRGRLIGRDGRTTPAIGLVVELPAVGLLISA